MHREKMSIATVGPPGRQVRAPRSLVACEGLYFFCVRGIDAFLYDATNLECGSSWNSDEELEDAFLGDLISAIHWRRINPGSVTTASGSPKADVRRRWAQFSRAE